MLTAAGLGVAMGNADPYLKSLSGLVTRSNDDGGFCDVLKRVINGEI
jgi:hydroxymethylpyrimidine pyrophosphatase-like HAD family hydrolase